MKRKKKNSRSRRDDGFGYVKEKLSAFREHCTLHYLPIDRISPQPYTTVSKITPPSALVESIRRYGLLEPLVVRRILPDNASAGALYSLLAGSMRLQALKVLGFEKAPCFICDISASEAPQAALSRKIGSFEGEADVFRIADAVARCAHESKLSPSELALRLCIDEETLARYLNLSEMQLSERRLCRVSSLSRALLMDIAGVKDAAARKRALKECAASLLYLKGAVADPFYAEGRRRGVFVSLLPFYNSIDRIASQMRLSGVAVSTERSESSEEYTITVHIPKQAHRVLIAPNESGENTDGVKFG